MSRTETRIDRGAVERALRNIAVEDGANLLDSGMVEGLVVRSGRVGFALDVAARGPDEGARLRQAAEAALREVPGVEDVRIVLTADRSAPPREPQRPARPDVPGVKAIIAVASGKGGVGKSTVAVNLAVALAKLGQRVGILDADIYGPSVPTMLGLSGRPTSDGKRITPPEAHGLKAMSIGLMIDTDTPMIWRGPMATGALSQLLTDVDWAPIDILVVDMPPGTGDIQLSLAQRVPLAGAVIVSTPQDIALIDARKAIAMFRKVEVPIIGLVENMSAFVCPECGTATHVFGHGGARRTAQALKVDFLGEIPLDLKIRETSDAGTPIASAAPGSAEAAAFMNIAAAAIDKLAAEPARPAPRIIME